MGKSSVGGIWSKLTQQEMRIHAVKECTSYEGPTDVAHWAANKDVGNVANVLFYIHS